MPPFLDKFMRPLLALAIAAFALPALGQDYPDKEKVQEAQLGFQPYQDVKIDVDCGDPKNPAQELICDDDQLWQMTRLDTWAYVYAKEAEKGEPLDHANPPIDMTFVAARDRCHDAACLITVIEAHTNRSLGDMSPYNLK